MDHTLPAVLPAARRRREPKTDPDAVPHRWGWGGVVTSMVLLALAALWAENRVAAHLHHALAAAQAHGVVLFAAAGDNPPTMPLATSLSIIAACFVPFFNHACSYVFWRLKVRKQEQIVAAREYRSGSGSGGHPPVRPD